MRLVLGSDHGGLCLKGTVKRYLEQAGHEVSDLGTHDDQSCDYPDFGRMVGEAVAAGEADFGVLICGTGIGMSMVANKVPGIRAALCTDGYMARMARAHNDANVLVMGERVIGPGLAEQILETFLSSSFEGERHARRVGKINALDQRD